MPSLSVHRSEQYLWGISLIVAPLLFLFSSFFWQQGEYSANGGTLVALGSVFWIPAFMGLFGRLKTKMPVYATWGLLIAIYGCVSGSSFGIRGIYAEAFSISKQSLMEMVSVYPLAFNLTMFWPGPLFPLSLLVLGVNLIRTKAVPLPVGVLLCAGAISFPLSRIPRIEYVAHIADLLLFLPLVYIGLTYLTRSNAIAR